MVGVEYFGYMLDVLDADCFSFPLIGEYFEDLGCPGLEQNVADPVCSLVDIGIEYTGCILDDIGSDIDTDVD